MEKTFIGTRHPVSKRRIEAKSVATTARHLHKIEETVDYTAFCALIHSEGPGLDAGTQELLRGH